MPMARPSRSAVFPGGWPSLRGASGYTANHVCDILNWGRGKVGRFEANQWKRPEMSDIRDLVRIYEIEGAEREEIEELAVRCRVAPWWREYGEIFDNEFAGYENDATAIRVFMPLLLPGLLQTPAYMEASFKTGPRPPAYRRKAVQARLRRQEILRPVRRDRAAPVGRDHRGVAALPMGNARRPQGADRASGPDEQAAQRRCCAFSGSMTARRPAFSRW